MHANLPIQWRCTGMEAILHLLALVSGFQRV